MRVDYGVNVLHAEEAEMSVIGAMILNASAVNEMTALLKPTHFYYPSHRSIFEAMCEMAAKNIPVDLVTLAGYMGSSSTDARPKGVSRLDEIGGPDFLIECAEFVPSAKSAAHYGTVVADCYQRRTIFNNAKKLMESAQNPDHKLDVLRAEAAAVGSTALADMRSPIIDFAYVDVEGEDFGITTGFPDLDYTNSTRGYPCGQMSVIRAYHKGGKTTFMVSSFVRQVEAGYRSLYITVADLNARRLKRRMLKQLTGFSKRPDSESGMAEEFARALTHIEVNWDAYCLDASALEEPSIESILAWVKAEHERKPFTGSVYIDYAQELHSSDRRANDPVTEQNICASRVNMFSAQTGLSCVVGSQITEGVGGGKAKTKYSRAWEEKAGLVYTIEREGECDANIEVTYSRFGPQDIKVPFYWNQKRLRFEPSASYTRAA